MGARPPAGGRVHDGVWRYQARGASVDVLVRGSPPREALVTPYAAYREHAAPAGSARATLVIETAPSGFQVRDARGAVIACRSPVELAIGYEFALTEALLTSCAQWLQLHAGGAVSGGRAMLALGPRGAGKSSLAFAWHRAGLPVLGDDVVLVDDGGRCMAFARLFKLAPEVLRAGGVDPRGTPYWAEGAAAGWYDPAHGAGWAAPAPPALLIRARHRRGARLTVRPWSRVAALNAVVHSLMPTGRGARDAFDVLAALVAGAECVTVTFGRALEAGERLRRMLP